MKKPSTAKIREAFPGDARWILEQADSLTLLSLAPGYPTWDIVIDRDGHHHRQPVKTVPGHDGGIRVLGEVAIKSRHQRRQVVGALYDSIARAWVGSACFEPHHAIRATRKGKSIGIVICFGCGYAYIYEGEKPEPISQFLVADHYYPPIFDKILRDHKVPIAR